MMRTNPPLHGLDVAFSTGEVPVKADRSAIVAAAVATEERVHRFSGDESELLWELADCLSSLPCGTIVSWNGSILLLPLLGYRAALHGVELDLQLWPDRRRGLNSLVAGMDMAVMATVGGHLHLDLRRLYTEDRRLGRPDEADLPEAHDLCRHDPATDARLLRSLASRRWSRASRVVDRPPRDWDRHNSVTTLVTERDRSTVSR